MYDASFVHVVTSDEAAASNGLVTKHGRILVHKVVLDGGASNAELSILLYDATTATGTAKIGLRVPVVATGGVFGSHAQADFSPPVPFEVGLSSDIANPGTARIYYTPQ